MDEFVIEKYIEISIVCADLDPHSSNVIIQQKKAMIRACSYIYIKGHYQKVNLVAVAESYKKQQ